MPPGTEESVRAVLEARARALAEPLTQEDAGETVGVIVLLVGDERFAVELRYVERIELPAELTPLPGVPELWAGLANVHNTLYPVLDLRECVGVDSTPPEGSQRVVLVSGAGIDAGLLADDVLDVAWIRRDAIGPAPRTTSGRGFVQGVTTDLLALLDLEALLADPALTVDDEAT